MKTKSHKIIQQSGFKRVTIITAAILMIPVIGRWPWGVFDFLIMGALILGAGCLLEYVVRNSNSKYSFYAAAAILLVLFLIWTELAVGLVSQLLSGELWIYELVKH